MKIHSKSLLALVVSAFTASSHASCTKDALEFHPSIGMQVEYVGSVPTNTTDAWTYNMNVEDNVDGSLFFLDQLMGRIYFYDLSSSDVTKIFDMTTSTIPDGITLDWVNSHAGIGQTNRVHAMTKGSATDEVIIVFTSTTLPDEYTKAHAQLPPEGAFPGFVCPEPQLARDLYRIGDDVDCLSSETIYNVFFKYTIDSDGTLSNPVPFFSLENQLTPGHFGGGIATVDDGRILWSVGDCLPFGSDGRFAPQLDWEHCGKILLIDPSDSTYEVAAKGVRNSQQFKIINRPTKSGSTGRDILVFTDIGGVTAEEVNAVAVNKLLKTDNIENFGWGRNMLDGNAREGTFYVAPGTIGVLGTEPPCEGDAPVLESGFIQPWIQFGRSETDFFYAVSSFAVAYESFDKLELIWSEFNTGLIMGTNQRFYAGAGKNYGPVTGYKIKLYDTDGNYLENGTNDLVQDVLGEVGYYRGDPRLFHYPDGTAGVFIERTGAYYRLTEIAI